MNGDFFDDERPVSGAARIASEPPESETPMVEQLRAKLGIIFAGDATIDEACATGRSVGVTLSSGKWEDDWKIIDVYDDRVVVCRPGHNVRKLVGLDDLLAANPWLTRNP